MRNGGFDLWQVRLLSLGAAQVGEEAVVNSAKRAGVPIEVADEVKALQRECRELRRANEIPRKASAYCAHAELDRPFG